MRLLEALHKTNRLPHCIDRDVRAAACWRSCCIKKCSNRKYAGGLDVGCVRNVERKDVEQFNFDGSTVRMQPAQHHPVVQAPSYMPQQHPNILQHQPRSPNVRARKCGVQHAAALQRSAPERRHVITSTARSPPHVALRVCHVCQAFDLARRLGRGGLEPDCREEVERKMGREGA
jgi:hypothetical protein